MTTAVLERTAETDSAPPAPAGRGRRLTALVLVGGLLLTLGLAAYAAKPRGVYWSSTEVRLLAPLKGSTYDDILNPPTTITMLAGALAEMADPSRSARISSDSATLAGQGIRHGYSVLLPNTGGQWANQFVSPYLQVQVVGTTVQEVRQVMSSLLARINADLLSLENRVSVPKSYLVRTQTSPPGTPPLYYQHGSRLRAVAISLVLGLGLTALASRAVPLLGRRASALRVRRQHPAPGLA